MLSPLLSFGQEIFSLILLWGFPFPPFYYKEEYIHIPYDQNIQCFSYHVYTWLGRLFCPFDVQMMPSLPFLNSMNSLAMQGHEEQNGRYFQPHQKCCGCCARALPFPAAHCRVEGVPQTLNQTRPLQLLSQHSQEAEGGCVILNSFLCRSFPSWVSLYTWSHRLYWLC